LYLYNLQFCKDTIFFCLNHDFNKIFKITKIFLPRFF